MTAVAFDVLGTPAPQGSKRAFINRSNGRAGMADVGAGKLNDWRAAVSYAAHAAMWETPGSGVISLPDGPLAVTLEFRLQRPHSIPKRRLWPHVRPDLDKLVRATLDGLTGVAIADDACVVLLAASKRYAVDEPTGCHVTIEPAETLDVGVAITQAVAPDLFVLDRAENPHPRMLAGARRRRAAGGNHWAGYLAAMADATGCDPADIETWMDRQ